MKILKWSTTQNSRQTWLSLRYFPRHYWKSTLYEKFILTSMTINVGTFASHFEFIQIHSVNLAIEITNFFINLFFICFWSFKFGNAFTVIFFKSTGWYLWEQILDRILWKKIISILLDFLSQKKLSNFAKLLNDRIDQKWSWGNPMP